MKRIVTTAALMVLAVTAATASPSGEIDPDLAPSLYAVPLFDYAVRELRFSDAAAQRRIQAMRLCRRQGWVRACLQSGELGMTSAAQLETTLAGAERAERQSHTGHRNVGQGRGRDQDHDSAGDGGRCCYRDPLSGRRCTSSHLLQIDHLLPVAEGGGPKPSNLVLRCFAHHRMRHGYGPAVPPQPPM